MARGTNLLWRATQCGMPFTALVVAFYLGRSSYVAPQPPVVDQPRIAAEALQKKISLSFGQESFDIAIASLSRAIEIPITIRNDDLQTEGVTKSQSFGLDEKDARALHVLRTAA